MTGQTRSFGSGEGDVWLIRTDSLGDTLWTTTFGDGGNETGKSVIATTDGGYIVAGDKDSFAWLIKTTPDPMNLTNKSMRKISEFKFSQNYPNPFNPSTTIEFDLPKTTEVSLKIFNILGEEVTTLVSETLSTGTYSYKWDASNLASGVYLYRLRAGDYVETKKMVLMR